MPRFRASNFRGAVKGGGMARDLSPVCPKCGAARGDRCFKLTSWVVDDSHRNGGFYTARLSSVHRERKEAAVKPVVDESPCNALRREINGLILVKLHGTGRVAVRRWAGSVHRTEADLTAKIDELKGLADLAW